MRVAGDIDRNMAVQTRNNRGFWAVAGVAVVLVAVLVVGCSAVAENVESVPVTVAERADVSTIEEAGDKVTGEHGISNEEVSNDGGEGNEAGHEGGPGVGVPSEEGEPSAEDRASGRELGLGDVYNPIRNGARLRMVYDLESNTFQGVVQNTTSETLCRVRVEVYLSNGTELGPTTPVNLPPGGALMGEIPAGGERFDGWSVQAETSACVGGEGEGSGEHGGEHGGD